MSTTITTVTDQIILNLQTLFSSKLELSNPYNPVDNNDVVASIGFGVAIGPCTNTQRVLSCKTSLRRVIEVVLTKKMYGSDRSLDARRNAEKALLEDQLSMIKSFNNDGTLDQNLSKMDFIDDNGIEFIFNDKYHYLMLRSRFEIEYLEDVI